MKKMIYKVSYVVVFLLLIVAASLLLSHKVSSKTQSDKLFDNHAFVQAEKSYQDEVSAILCEYKCFDSGINLTREVGLDGERTYQLYLHNRQFELLSKEQFDGMCSEIRMLEIKGQNGKQYVPTVVFSRSF